jgi:hypothetical protein
LNNIAQTSFPFRNAILRSTSTLFSINIGQPAIRAFAKAMRDGARDAPSPPGVFPGDFAPIVRNAPGGARERRNSWSVGLHYQTE